jgi:hypothetical protein
MTETEGVIKFDLHFHSSPVEPSRALDELLQWRDVFFRLGVIGQDPARYEGFAYGNISHRSGSGNQFIISGSQTGGLTSCLAEHYSIVDACDVETNHVEAHGPIAPSSESLTHGAIYALSERIQCVVHGHTPLIWKKAVALGIPATSPEVEYGTPQMAHAIERLYREHGRPDQALFAMLGHEDGIIAYGDGFAAIETMWKEIARQAESI